MRALALDTNVWQYVIHGSSRDARQQFVRVVRRAGLRLGFTDEIVREVVSNQARPQMIQPLAATIWELTEHWQIESSHLADARELVEALERDHPEWITPGADDAPLRHARQAYGVLRDMARGRIQGRQPTAEDADADLRARRTHERLRHGHFLEDMGDYRTWPIDEVVAGLRADLARPVIHAGVPPGAPVRAPVKLSKTDREARVRIQLLVDIAPAFETQLAEHDYRRLLVARLGCDLPMFVGWVLHEMRDDDLPTLRVQVAVALGQALDGYSSSDMGDREHASVLPRAGLLVTSDQGLARALGRKEVAAWLPPRWRLLTSPTSTDALARLTTIVSSA